MKESKNVVIDVLALYNYDWTKIEEERGYGIFDALVDFSQKGKKTQKLLSLLNSVDWDNKDVGNYNVTYTEDRWLWYEIYRIAKAEAYRYVEQDILEIISPMGQEKIVDVAVRMRHKINGNEVYKYHILEVTVGSKIYYKIEEQGEIK